MWWYDNGHNEPVTSLAKCIQNERFSSDPNKFIQFFSFAINNWPQVNNNLDSSRIILIPSGLTSHHNKRRIAIGILYQMATRRKKTFLPTTYRACYQTKFKLKLVLYVRT